MNHKEMAIQLRVTYKLLNVLYNNAFVVKMRIKMEMIFAFK